MLKSILCLPILKTNFQLLTRIYRCLSSYTTEGFDKQRDTKVSNLNHHLTYTWVLIPTSTMCIIFKANMDYSKLE